MLAHPSNVVADLDLVLTSMAVVLVDRIARSDRGAGGGGADEENTYGLPQGERLRKLLRDWFGKQRAEVLGTIPARLDPLPAHMPDLTRDTKAMAESVTPVLTAYWDEGGKATRERLGLDPDEWRVESPHLRTKIREAALDFCHTTNRTTTQQLGRALERLREEFIAGVADRGETIDQLTTRVQSVFDTAEEWRARRIAATEASRAVHAAQEQAAADSDVVAGLELLLSSDACPLCRKIATEVCRVQLGQPFAVIGRNAAYRDVKYPPLHPGCQCTAIEVLKPEFGGPADPTWGHTLTDPKPGPTYTPPPGKTVPKPEPERVKPLRPEAQPKPEPKPKPKPKPAPKKVSAPKPTAPFEPPRKPDIASLATVEDRLAASARYAREYGVETLTHGHDWLRSQYGAKADRIPGAYVGGQAKAIVLNERNDYWKDPAGWMRQRFERREFSTPDPDHAITHEIGHALHQRSVGEERYSVLFRQKLTHEQATLARDHVSRYAGTQPIEFVAETYAGLKVGTKYPKPVMDLYQSFGGPIP